MAAQSIPGVSSMFPNAPDLNRRTLAAWAVPLRTWTSQDSAGRSIPS